MNFAEKVIVGCIGVVVVLVALLFREYNDIQPNEAWYLGCSDRNGEELLLKTEKRPRISDGGIVFLEDQVFVTPTPGSTCRIISENELKRIMGVDKQL